MQQRYGLVLTSPPAAEPVSLADAKAWARVSTADDDAIFTALIAAARQFAEDYTGRAFVTQSWRLTLDRFPGVVGSSPTVYTAYRDWPVFWDLVRLPKPPLQSVDSVAYVDTAGATDVIDPSLYQADADAEPARLRPAYGQIWPVPRAQPAAVRVAYTCGYGAAAAVPAGISTAIKMLVAAWYEGREAVGEKAMTEAPLAVRALLDQFWVGSYLVGVGAGDK